MAGDSRTNIVQVVIGIFCVAILAVLFGAGEAENRQDSRKKDAIKNYRGLTMASVIFGNANNDFMPGLTQKGEIVKAGEKTTGSTSLTGASVSGRLWILLNGQFIGGDLLISPAAEEAKRRLVKWEKQGPVSNANHSVAALQIAELPTSLDSKGHEGRRDEWKNNANSQAVLYSDFNSGLDSSDKQVASLWTRKPGDWQGAIVWGDCHGEFVQSSLGFTTRYHMTTNKADNLFASKKSVGVSESSEKSDANAMMVYSDEVAVLSMGR